MIYDFEHKLNNYDDMFVGDVQPYYEHPKYVHNNLDSMDKEEMIYHVSKILSFNKMKKILLEYELTNYKLESRNLDLEQFTKIAIGVLHKYGILCSMLEDKWIIITENDVSEDYNVKKNEVLFENTVFKGNVNDSITLDYLDKLVTRLNSISTRIKSKCVIEKDRNDIYCVLIWSKMI